MFTSSFSGWVPNDPWFQKGRFVPAGFLLYYRMGTENQDGRVESTLFETFDELKAFVKSNPVVSPAGASLIANRRY